MKYISVLLLIILSVSLFGTNNSEDVYFTNVMEENGLAPLYSECGYQDKTGLLWFGYNGLSRFDGKELISFSFIPGDSTSIISNVVVQICPDKEDNLWLATKNGLCFFNTSTYQFKNYPSAEKGGIGSKYINDLCQVDDTIMLVGTMTDGLYLFNKKTGLATACIHSNDDSLTLINNSVRRIVKADNESYWIGTSGGLDLFNVRTRRFDHYLRGKDVRDLAKDIHKQVWVTTYKESDFYMVDAKSMQILSVKKFPDTFKERMKRIHFDKEGKLWIAVLDRGVYRVDPEISSEPRLLRNSNNDKHRTISGPLRIFDDSFGNIWITSFAEGIFLYNPQRMPFELARNPLSFDEFDCASVRYLFQDQDGDIWVGARDGCIISQYFKNQNRFKNYKVPVGNLDKVKDDIIVSMEDGDAGKLWIGTLHSGLWQFDKRTNVFKPFKSGHHRSRSVYALLKDNDGNLWIGYDNDGIDVYNQKEGIIAHYEYSPTDSNSISDNSVRSIIQDKKGNIWIGTLNKGANCYHPTTGQFQRFSSKAGDTASLIDNRVHCVYEDTHGNIWMGTFGGLNLFIQQTGTFKQYGIKYGFGFDVVFNILEDASGNLWLNSEQGISKFDVSTHSFRNYTNADGLQGSVFSISSCQLKSGELLFGGINGFNIFNPEKIKEDMIAPTTIMTDLKINGKSVAIYPNGILMKHISSTENIALTYKDKMVSIDFAALLYGNIGNVDYAYRLAGFNNEWTYTNGKRSATYTNLSPGNYIFEVKASNNDGYWNDKPCQLFITIAPPPWKTVWAYVIYFLVALVIILKYRNFQIKRQEEKRRKAMDEERLVLFTNISHEFRTPLTLMLNPIQELQAKLNESELGNLIMVINRSAQKLMYLVDQVLDFRKLDSGMTKLRLEKINIASYTKSITDLFNNLAASKDIQIEFRADFDVITIPLDRDKYEKILNNLLSNSLKYTNLEGHVLVSLSKETKTQSGKWRKLWLRNQKIEYLKIEVRDTGIGLTEEQKKQVLNRFYQVSSYNTGTGIGLNYVKNLVDLHHGQMNIQSEYKKGTSVSLFFYLDEKRYNQDDFIAESVLSDERLQNQILDVTEYDLMSEYTNGVSGDSIPETSATKNSVLIVEDNKELVSQIKEFLLPRYRVITAYNGKDGAAKAVRHLPDIVVSDIMMPEMDGLELCEYLKTNEDTCHIPVVLLTAKGQIEDRLAGFEIGADEYIPKPFYMKLLEARIKNLIKNRRLVKERFNTGSLLGELLNDEDLGNKDEAFLNKITKYVIDNLDNSELKIQDVCTEISVSASYLFNRIGQLTGQNPSGFIRTVRLKCAAEMLQKGDSEVKEICFKVGFSSHAYFSKCFKELYNCSPTEYKKGLQ